MDSPVFLITFANARERPLPGLQTEETAIDALLRPWQSHYYMHRDQFLTAPKLAELLADYSDKLMLFHYSGHAGPGSLGAEGGPAYSAGLARQFGACPELRCVVLNGCSTKGQVVDLLREKVRVVIATAADIDDARSVEFSKGFYTALAEGKTLDEAFTEGTNRYATVAGEISVRRDSLGALESTGFAPGETMWGIFYNKAEALHWTLHEVAAILPYKPNEYLIRQLAGTFSFPGSKLDQFKKQEERGGLVHLTHKRNEIFNCLPFPIAEQMRLLLQPPEADGDRELFGLAGRVLLNQIVATYTTTVRLMSCVMLAQLWDIVLSTPENQSLNISKELKEQLKNYLFEADRGKFSSLKLVQGIRAFLDEAGIDYFVQELAALRDEFQEGTDFFTACEHLEKLYERLRNSENSAADERITNTQAALLCKAAEYKLADFFRPLGFIYRYELRSILNIDLWHIRHMRILRYRHHYITLTPSNGQEANQKHGPNADILDGYFDPSSVTLVRDFHKREFLNLSPFIIDENTFTGGRKVTKLMFFECFNRQEHMLEYSHAYQPKDPRLKIQFHDGEHLPFKPICDQFDEFVKRIF